MAKIFQVRAPKTMKLHLMSNDEISELVTSEAEKVFQNLPEGMRPVGVNSVRIDQLMPGGGGGWAEWTRACCNKRRQIEDYTDPVRSDWEVVSTGDEQAVSAQDHIETSFKIQGLSDSSMHPKKSRKKR